MILYLYLSLKSDIVAGCITILVYHFKRQENEAAEIEGLAIDALNTSREAHQIALAAIQGQGQTTDEIEKIRNQ